MTTQKPHAANERGASAVEYALLIAGIAAVIVAVLLLLGANVTDQFQGACDNIASEQGSDC